MKSILVLFILITNILANSVSLDPDVLNKTDEDTNTYHDDKKLFIQFGLAGSYIIMKDDLKDSVKNEGVDDSSGIGIDVGIGYRWQQFFATSIFLQRYSLSSIDILNLGFGANYYLDNNLYFGAVAGNSFLTWKKSPVKDTISEIKEQSNPFWGVEFGFDYGLKNSFSLYTKYQLLFLNHKTDINYDKDIIEHNIQNNLGVGVKYGF